MTAPTLLPFLTLPVALWLLLKAAFWTALMVQGLAGLLCEHRAPGSRRGRDFRPGPVGPFAAAASKMLSKRAPSA